MDSVAVIKAEQACESGLEGKRLLLALPLSFLLHGVAVFASYPDARNMAAKPFSGRYAQENNKASAFLTAALTTANRGSKQSPNQLADSGTIFDRRLPFRVDASNFQEDAGIIDLQEFAYYEPEQLSKRPEPLEVVELETPDIQGILGSGKLILKLWIDDQGKVDDVVVEQSELPEIFGAAAVVAFKNFRFTPGERNGLRVGSLMRVEVDYKDM